MDLARQLCFKEENMRGNAGIYKSFSVDLDFDFLGRRDDIPFDAQKDRNARAGVVWK